MSKYSKKVKLVFFEKLIVSIGPQNNIIHEKLRKTFEYSLYSLEYEEEISRVREFPFIEV